jgi:hypothetical protein
MRSRVLLVRQDARRRRSISKRWGAALAALVTVVTPAAIAAASATEVDIDRVVVRFDAPETGGASTPQFVFERELAFEARLEALADVDRAQGGAPYLDRHVRAALERHVAEELLSHLAMDPEPRADEIARRSENARGVLEQRVGGAAEIRLAADAEGVGESEIDALVLREARASLYLDRMVAPMLEPSDAELREIHHATTNPFRNQRFEEVIPVLRKWYVGERLEAALGAFYQNARGRVHMVVIPP